MGLIEKPHGFTEIIKVFGDPGEYEKDHLGWEQAILEIRPLPTPLLYAYAELLVRRVRAHKLIVDHLVETLDACVQEGVPLERMHYGGCYVWREKRLNKEPSTHMFGIAVDIEPIANPIGTAWKADGKMLHPGLIQVFKEKGWTWGGEFHRPDVMHWQWATGY